MELHHGDLSLADVIAVAKILDADGKNLSKNFTNHVKCVIGSVRSFGNVTIDGKTCKQLTEEINAGEVEIPEN